MTMTLCPCIQVVDVLLPHVVVDTMSQVVITLITKRNFTIAVCDNTSNQWQDSGSPCLDLTDDSASSVRNGRDGKQRCLEEQHNNVT